MAFIFKCPACAQKFKTSDWPEKCPLCAYDTSVEDNEEICLPFISKAANKSADQVYRDMERGSEERMHMASDMTPGASPSDFADLKITNLNDRRDTEVAAMPVNNDVTRFMAANPQAPVGFQSGGVEYSGQVSSGPFANAGAHTQNLIRKTHAQNVTGHAGAVSSDLPALETMNPLYRRRV